MPWILIGGGVGPMAGVELHRLIIEHTATDGRDQSHLSVVHLAAPERIPDRTEYLLGREARNPGTSMGELLARFLAGIEAPDLPAVVGVPCNTFHAPPIIDAFFAALGPLREAVVFENMVERAVMAVLQVPGAAGGVGLMSTTGTRGAGIYSAAFARAGARVLQVEDSEQDALHESIYHSSWGLKAVSPPSARAVERVERLARSLVQRGARVLVPACTELPLVLSGLAFEGVPVIDPVRVLARALVARAGGTLTDRP